MTLGLRHRLRGVRELGRGSGPEIAAALAADPIATCMVASRFEAVGMDPGRLGGSFYSAPAGGALCFIGANILPVRGTGAALAEIGAALYDRRPTTASIVGRAEYVLPLWESVRHRWGAAREERPDQPLMTCPDDPAVGADPRVAPVDRDQLAAYYPAAVAMFTEEVGVDPTASDGGARYRGRISALVGQRRAFAIIEANTVIYKAEIGSLSTRVGLIQGVWVHPDWRGRGIAAPATAAVVQAIQRSGRLPSLYVNSFNTAARAVYRRIGFDQVGTFATILL